MQRAQGCFTCSLLSFKSYIVPRFKAMESLQSLSLEISSQFESSLTKSMRSFVTRLCQPLHDPTPSLSFSTPEPSGIFGRREESSEIDKTTLFACIKIRDLNLFSPPQSPFLFLLYSSTVYFYKIYFPQVANKNKALGD